MSDLTWSEIAALVTALIAVAGATVAVFLKLVTWTLDRWSTDLKQRQDAFERSITRRQDELEHDHAAHEDLCGERYKAIAEQHHQLVKVSDERHCENRDRLESMEAKLDLLLTRPH